MPATSSISGLPGGLPSKGTASISVDQSAQPSPAQLSGLTHEAEDSPPPTATPLTIHSAAQRGDLHAIRTLIESGRAKATDRDEDNITPLHWASINAQVPTCQYLLDQGAEVDALGGDLVASPLQWAARSGHLYVMHLLISHHADPTLTDAQGFNALHLTTHSSAVMPLVYILQQPSMCAGGGIDSQDAQGHTALMWAAYQGDAISVDLLLQHGADVHKRDSAGLTPMHWAVVKGNRLCIRRLMESGSDLWAKEAGGKTPRDMALELKSIGAFKKALADIGFEEDGRRKSKPLNERNTRIAIMLVPFAMFGLIFSTLSILPWFTGVPLAMAEFFGMHHIVTRVLLDPLESESMQKSPYFLAIVSGSIGWVGWVWATRIVQNTPGYASANLVFAIAFLLCAWNLFRAASLEPGYAPRAESESQRRMVVEQLADEARLNGMNYCVNCMARRPLRSKHCRFCKRCVARHDHHCPWVSNCIGVQNHRQFIIFVISLVFGISTFDYLIYAYYSLNAPAYVPDITSSCLLTSSLCAATTFDGFAFSTSIWASLQLTWTSVLFVAQIWQIARQMTTFEVSNLGRYGFMGGKGGSSMATQAGFMQQHGPRLSAAASLAAAEGDGDLGGDGPNQVQGPRAGRHSHGVAGALAGGSSWLLSILGLDLYTRGKAGEGLKKASAAGNPFDMGLVRNCQDFWTRGRELGVRYEELYDVPVGGFRTRRDRERGEPGSISGGRVEGGSSQGAGGAQRRWSMWAGLKRGFEATPRRGGYELVSSMA